MHGANDAALEVQWHPFFILGAPHSGTTLIARMLDESFGDRGTRRD